MEFFLTHIVNIVIIAVVIALLAAVWAFAASYNARKRSPEMQRKQDKACDSCALASMCTRFGADDESCGDYSSEVPHGER